MAFITSLFCLIFYKLFVFIDTAEDQPKKNGEHSGEYHAVFRWQHKSEGVCGDPEERDGVGIHKSPHTVPIHGFQGRKHVEFSKRKFALVFSDEMVCDVVDKHKNRRKDQVKEHRNGEGGQNVAEGFLKAGEKREDFGGAVAKNGKRSIDNDAENSPQERFWQQNYRPDILLFD